MLILLQTTRAAVVGGGIGHDATSICVHVQQHARLPEDVIWKATLNTSALLQHPIGDRSLRLKRLAAGVSSFSRLCSVGPSP